MSQPSTPAATPKRKRISHRQSVAEFIAEANARKVKWVTWADIDARRSGQ